jgi:hypothetical protein
MIVRVDWAQPNSDGNKMYNVYEATEYFVEGLTPKDCHPSAPITRLMLDIDRRDIILNNGDVVYVMNDNGKTIDVIRT